MLGRPTSTLRLVHLAAGPGDGNLQVMLGEVIADEVPYGGVVIDDEDVGFQVISGRVEGIGAILRRQAVESPKIPRGADPVNNN